MQGQQDRTSGERTPKRHTPPATPPHTPHTTQESESLRTSRGTKETQGT